MMQSGDDLRIENTNFSNQEIKGHDFSSCFFSGCDFSETKLICCKFVDCVFTDCNLSMASLAETLMNNVEFKNCKLLGVKFNHCNSFIFQVGFADCMLDYSSFEKRKMAKTLFKKSSLKGVDFAGADLKLSKMISCDLTEAIFYNTNLQEVDFTSSFNYDIDLDVNTVKKTRFSRENLDGLLRKYAIIIE